MPLRLSHLMSDRPASRRSGLYHMKGAPVALNIRVARALNRIAKRKGGVFDDGYDARVISTPRSVMPT